MDSTEDFDIYLQGAWARHDTEMQAVASSLASVGLGLVGSSEQLVALARLTQHVWGEHLGDAAGGRAALAPLRQHGLAIGEAAATLRVLDAALALAASQSLPTLDSDSQRIRASALAAASVFEAPRALALLLQAASEADGLALEDKDPACRALAVSSNNLAARLQRQPLLSAHEQQLMLEASAISRRFWARAGGWLEVERAEYGLALSWLKAGDGPQALHHAQLCRQLVDDNQGPAFERFFAAEAIVLAARGADQPALAEQALRDARQRFAELSDDDREVCRSALDKIAA